MSSKTVWLFVLLGMMIVVAISGFLWTRANITQNNKLNLQEKALKEKTKTLEERTQNLEENYQDK